MNPMSPVSGATHCGAAPTRAAHHVRREPTPGNPGRLHPAPQAPDTDPQTTSRASRLALRPDRGCGSACVGSRSDPSVSREVSGLSSQVTGGLDVAVTRWPTPGRGFQGNGAA